ncbi:MAG: hypothetical protein M0P95_12560 [Sulfuritalea sp.]|nr:hypothetical protein [Sulfuritalea sp.]
MNKHTLRLLAVSATYFALSPTFAADVAAGTTTTVSTTTTDTDTVDKSTGAVPATRIATRFESLAGSRQNSASLVAGLRSGTAVTLSSPGSATVMSFTPTTKPMGYGNVTQALTLAQRQLAAQGITQPTPVQLSTALNGGTLTTTSSSGATRTVEMAGVLQLRSQGMGWGQIAHQLSVSPGYRAATATTTAGSTQGTVDLRGSTHSNGAIVSGDGAIMHGRAPGVSTTTETRGQQQAHGQEQIHARAEIVRTSSPSSIAGSSSSGMANQGIGSSQAHGHGRF